MDKKERRYYFWNSAALGGLIMGAILALGIVLPYLFQSKMEWITNISIMLAFVGVGYIAGKRFERGMQGEVLTFGRALGFTLSMVMFAGIIYGVATYIMYSHAPAYFRSQQLEQLRATEASQELIDLASQSFDMMLNNPLITIFSAIFTMLIYGLFPSLITAAMIRTRKLPQQPQN